MKRIWEAEMKRNYKDPDLQHCFQPLILVKKNMFIEAYKKNLCTYSTLEAIFDHQNDKIYSLHIFLNVGDGEVH